MKEIVLNGLRYFYRRQGSGPLLLLLHGFTGSSENWHELMPYFAEQYDVLALDLPGHGRTQSPPDPARYEMATVAADIAALLTTLALDRPQAHVLGYSMGGRLALYLAVHYPELVRSLVLESASPGLATETERAQRQAQDKRLADEIEREGLAAFVERWEALPLFASQRRLPAGIQQRHRQLRLQNNPAGLANSLRGMGTGRQPSLWPHLPAVQLPGLLLAGQEDAKFVGIAQQMVAQLPQAQLVIVPEAGHTIHLEQPEGYGRIVRDWLAAH